MDVKDQIRAKLLSESAFSREDVSGSCLRDNVCTIYLQRPDLVAAKQAKVGNGAVEIVNVGAGSFEIRYEYMARPSIPFLLPRAKAIPQAGFDRTARWESIFPGVSAGHKNVTAGTTGFYCDTWINMVSNAHVFAPEGFVIGDELLQPGPLDGGVLPADQYATLTKTTIPDWNAEQIEWDLAVGRMIAGRTYNSKALGIATPKTVRNPVVGESVAKSGRTTAVTGALVESIDFDVVVNYSTQKQILCKNSTRYSPAFIEGGDSGSPVLATEDNAAVDVIFAGSQDYSFGVGRLVEGLQDLGYNLFVMPDVEHDWRLDSESSLTVPVTAPPNYFEIISHELDPPNPFPDFPVTLYTVIRPALNKRWIKVELWDGTTLLQSQWNRMGVEDYVVTAFRTPPQVGAWNLTQKIYFDALEGA